MCFLPSHTTFQIGTTEVSEWIRISVIQDLEVQQGQEIKIRLLFQSVQILKTQRVRLI